MGGHSLRTLLGLANVLPFLLSIGVAVVDDVTTSGHLYQDPMSSTLQYQESIPDNRIDMIEINNGADYERLIDLKQELVYR